MNQDQQYQQHHVKGRRRRRRHNDKHNHNHNNNKHNDKHNHNNNIIIIMIMIMASLAMASPCLCNVVQQVHLATDHNILQAVVKVAKKASIIAIWKKCGPVVRTKDACLLHKFQPSRRLGASWNGKQQDRFGTLQYKPHAACPFWDCTVPVFRGTLSS